MRGVAGSQTLLYRPFLDAAKIMFYIGRKKSSISISFIVIHLSGQCLRKKPMCTGLYGDAAELIHGFIGA